VLALYVWPLLYLRILKANLWRSNLVALGSCKVSRNWEQPRAAAHSTMLFWLRFFGYKRTPKLGKSYENPAGGGLYIPSSRKSIAYNPSEMHSDDDVAPLDGSFAFARKRSQGRSAIDLERGVPSIDLGSGPGGRMSVDSIPSRQHHLGTMLNFYMNFVTIHKGKNAKIVKATNRYTGARVVLKMFNKGLLSAVQLDDISKEIQVLKLTKQCDGIVDFETTFEDEALKTIVLKDCTGGTLISRLSCTGGRMAEEVCVRCVAKPLVSVLASLHEKGIVHRDLKPEHILYDEHDDLRLVDFMSSARLGKDPLTGREGTLAYMAPEVVTKPTPDEIFHEVICHGIAETDLPAYDEKADIWSLGVVIVEALTGRQPFLADSAERLYQIQQQELRGDQFGGVLDFVRDQEFLSLEGQDFLSSIFRLNPGDRPSAQDLLSHPWLDLVGSDDGGYP